MGLLAWLGTLGAALSEWFARKGLVAAAYGAAFFGVLATYTAAVALIHDAVSALDNSLMDSAVRVGGSSVHWYGYVAMFIPDNMAQCIAILVDAVLLKLAFRLTHQYIQGLASAS